MNEFLKLNWKMTLEEIDAMTSQTCFITDEVVSNSLIYKNFDTPLKKIVKKDAKMKGLNEKPVVPGETLVPQYTKGSRLNAQQHKDCLKALKLLHSGRDLRTLNDSNKATIEHYNALKENIVSENKEFRELASNLWEKDKIFLKRLKPGIQSFAKYCWQKKFERYLDYSQFYKEINLFNMVFNENEATIEFTCLQNLLELGSLARFSQPSFKTKCTLNCSTLPAKDIDETEYSKLPVSEDKNIDSLLVANNIDIVISGSGLKRITDNSDLKALWIIPVLVKNCKIKQGVSNKKVVYVDKPLCSTKPDTLDLALYTYKRLLKTNFCQYEAFRFPCEEVKKPHNTHLIDKLNKLEENIFGDSGENNKSEEQGTSMKKRKLPDPSIIHHNVNYRLWHIKKIDFQNNLMKGKSTNVDLNVLVRTKLDACECTDQGPLQPVIIRPKLEYQIKFGANIPTKSELLREWTDLFFRPYSNLYRARLHSPSGEVITLEKCNMQKVASEASTHYDLKPSFGLGNLEKVLSELVKLKPGSYLLKHLPKHESFVSIMEECDKSIFDKYNLHKEFDSYNIENQISKNWVPIDVNYILPVHEAANRMPGMFLPFQRRQFTKGIKKNKSKKKKKMVRQNTEIVDL